MEQVIPETFHESVLVRAARNEHAGITGTCVGDVLVDERVVAATYSVGHEADGVAGLTE